MRWFFCMFGVRRRASTICHGRHGEDCNSGFSQGAVVHDLGAGAALAQMLAVLYRAGGRCPMVQDKASLCQGLCSASVLPCAVHVCYSHTSWAALCCMMTVTVAEHGLS